MLRTLLVCVLIGFGLRHAARGPFYALLFYLWVAYFRPEFWVWGGSFIQQISLSLGIGVLAVSWALASGQLKLDLRVLPLVLLVAQSLFSSLLSEHTDFCLVYWMDFAKSIAITWLIASLATDLHKLRLVVLIMAISLGFEAVKQGWAQLLLNPGAKNFNEIAFLGDNNGVAVGMFTLAALFVVLSRTAATKLERWGHQFAVVGVLYRGISTYSRGGFLAALAMGGLYLARSRRKVLAAFAIVIVAAVIAPVLPPEFWERMGTIRTSLADNQDGSLSDDTGTYDSAQSRLHFWSIALAMAADRPLTGVGHNAYSLAYDAYDSSQGEYGQGRSVHSSWFGILAELGYPGLVLVIVNVLAALLACRRARRVPGDGPEERQLREYAAGIETGLAVILVGGSFVIFQYSEMLWHLIGVSIALNRLAVRRPAVALEAPPPAHSIQARLGHAT